MYSDDFNRVLLKTIPEVDNSDYINARYVIVRYRCDKFITSLYTSNLRGKTKILYSYYNVIDYKNNNYSYYRYYYYYHFIIFIAIIIAVVVVVLGL